MPRVTKAQLEAQLAAALELNDKQGEETRAALELMAGHTAVLDEQLNAALHQLSVTKASRVFWMGEYQKAQDELQSLRVPLRERIGDRLQTLWDSHWLTGAIWYVGGVLLGYVVWGAR